MEGGWPSATSRYQAAQRTPCRIICSSTEASRHDIVMAAKPAEETWRRRSKNLWRRRRQKYARNIAQKHQSISKACIVKYRLSAISPRNRQQRKYYMTRALDGVTNLPVRAEENSRKIMPSYSETYSILSQNQEKAKSWRAACRSIVKLKAKIALLPALVASNCVCL